jgi:hypothetical protein
MQNISLHNSQIIITIRFNSLFIYVLIQQPKYQLHSKYEQRDNKKKKHKLTRAQFEVLAAVVIMSSIFWDITPCSPLKVNQRV